MRIWNRLSLIPMLMLPLFAQAVNLSGKGYVEARQQERLADASGRSLGQRYEALLEGQMAHKNLRFDGVFLGRYRSQYDVANTDIRDELGREAQLREYYLTWSADAFEIRLGRQQQAWGRADYFRVVDVLNPLDLREFLLPYIDNYSLGRTPRDMLIVDYFADQWEHQWVVAPERKATQLAPAGSDFAMTAMPPALPPEHKRGDGVDVGWRGKTFWQGRDIELYAFRGYHSDAMLAQHQGDWVRQQPRRDFVGASLAQPAGDWIIRSDVAHYWQEGRQISSGIKDSQRSTALLGFDRNKNDWNLNLQMAATRWHDDTDGNDTVLEGSVSVDRNWYQQRLNTGLIWMVNHQDHTSHLWRATIRYNLYPQWDVALTAVVFDGRQTTLFGQYDQQDRVILTVRRNFSW